MIEEFETIIYTLTGPQEQGNDFLFFDPMEQFDEGSTDDVRIASSLNVAFLIVLAGNRHPVFERANNFLTRMVDSSDWADAATFYLNVIEMIHREIETVGKHDPDFRGRIKSLSEWVSDRDYSNNLEETTEKIWSVFFPEATGIRKKREERIEALRAKRTLTITEPNPVPINEPARQILFTSNVLLTLPPASKSNDELAFSSDLKQKLIRITSEPQLYWYDHPIQIGIEPEKNEVLYGLRCLDSALEFERSHGNMADDSKLTCILSVSVTHQGLQDIAQRYLEEEFARIDRLKNIDLYMFTEADTGRIIDKILIPAAGHYLGYDGAEDLLKVFGVDGEYGRHYNFLKAIAALWSVFVDPEIKATFKIDLDQVFPQQELVDQTGSSVFEHFKTTLWGAKGIDYCGQAVEMGMIAGALVNERDISKSLFTPDISFPNRELAPDEYIFFSLLPQALSTVSEMTTRYSIYNNLDGKRKCIQRIHVTGGTNGILIESLRRHRPFTPSFIGRAEDQAYILSVLFNAGPKLAYVHKDGLIMRHDKDIFAQEAIKSASIGKLLGDYIRTLYFSAYARVLTDDYKRLKDTVGPFTGCFISKIPTTVVCLRFALKAASFFVAGQNMEGVEFVATGAQRIRAAFDFVNGDDSELKQQYKKERRGWDLYYEILSTIEQALDNNDPFALNLRKKVEDIIGKCSIRFN